MPARFRRSPARPVPRQNDSRAGERIHPGGQGCSGGDWYIFWQVSEANKKMKFDINKNCKINLALVCFCLFIFQSKDISAEDNINNNVYRELTEKGVATYEDGCRGISHFTDIDEKNLTFDELVLELKKKEIIGKRWKYEAEKPLTRGIVSYMICKVLKIKGGLTMRVINAAKSCAGLMCSGLKIKNGLAAPDIGMTKRYAYLECLDMGLMPAGHKETFLTGHDLLALMYRIEQHIKAGEKDKKHEKEKGKENEQEKQEQSKSEESSG